MDNEYGLLGDDEVLFVRSGRIIVSNPTFKVSEFLDALAQLISEQEGEWSDEREGWFTDRGQTCEVLRLGNQGWQRGRVRIRLEFCPDRPPKLLRESLICGQKNQPEIANTVMICSVMMSIRLVAAGKRPFLPMNPTAGREAAMRSIPKSTKITK